MSNFFDDIFKENDNRTGMYDGGFNRYAKVISPFERDNILNDLAVNSQVKKVLIPVREIHYSEENGFGAYVCEDTAMRQGLEIPDEMNISGEFASQLIIGQTYHVEGMIKGYRGENQIKVEKIWNVRPVGKRGTIAYLQTLKGLKKKAELIFNEFGNDSIKMLIENPMLVSKKIAGIGKKSVMTWKDELDKLAESQQTISALLGWGISMKQAKKLYDKYKDFVVDKIKENPYFLAVEVKGYGFEKCDKIAKEVGISPRSSYRLQEGLMYVLQMSSTSGNCFLTLQEIIVKSIQALTIRLSYQEMKRFAKEHSGKETFVYAWGNPEVSSDLLKEDEPTNIFTINYNDMMGKLYDYENERQNKMKESHRYVVCKISDDEIGEQIIQLAKQSRIIADEDRIYLKQIFYDELKVAERVIELAQTEAIFTRNEIIEVLDEYLDEKGIVLEEKQREAVILFNLNKGGFSLLLGNAGTGKTFCLLIILEVKKRLYKKKFNKILDTGIMVFAPTGKASKVASRATGMDCVTVHRGLGYNPGTGFSFNAQEPLPADILVVDESSMLDISLTKSLLEAIATGTQIIFMGDTKQLPSVGAGNVLSDLIASGAVDVIELDVVKRQGLLSGIIKNANNIIEGRMIETCNDTKDAFFIKREAVAGCQNGIIESIKRVLSFDGYDHSEIQVLAPQRKGSMGTYMLNYLLQKEFNPGNEEHKILDLKFEASMDEDYKNSQTFELFFKKNDKVIHVKNNYDMELYSKDMLGGYRKLKTTGITNGECGIIEDIVTVSGADNSKTNRIIVRYDEWYAFYDGDFLELEHAWALTIHKSQGSAWSCVILPMMNQYWNMLENNILYTGWTRARSFAVVVGSPRAVLQAIKTKKSIKRNTYLAERIIKLKQVA